MKKKTLLLSCLAAASLPAMAQAEVPVTSPTVHRPSGGAILLAATPKKVDTLNGAKQGKVDQKGIKLEQKGIKVDQKVMKKEEQKVLGTRRG